MFVQPLQGRGTDPILLGGAHRGRGTPVGGTGPRLDLAEHEEVTASEGEVDLTATAGPVAIDDLEG